MRIIAVTMVCLAASSRAVVAESAAPLTVDAAVKLAMRNNPRLIAAAREVAAARAGVGAAQSLAGPSITVTPSIVGPAGSDQELSIEQPLELNGARGARTRVARAALQVSRNEALVAVRDLVRDVKLAYFELARAQEALDLQRNSVAIAEEFERIARRQVEVGTRPGIDLTQLQLELTRTRQLALQAEASVHLASATLNTLLGRSPATLVGSVSRLAFAAAPLEAPPSLETALSQRAEVAAQQSQLTALRQQSRLIRAEGRPDLALIGRMDQFTRRPSLGGVGIGISLPLIDYGRRRNRLRQSERLAEAQSARIEATRNTVRLNVEAAVTRLRTAEQLARQYQEGLVDQARRLAEAERTRFQTGAGSPLAVLEAQRTYRSVLSDYYSVLAAHEQAKAELEWALGSVRPPDEIVYPERAGSARSNP